MQQLRAFGWNPSKILDVGAFVGDWTRGTQQIFPRAQFTMIEANPRPGLPAINEVLASSVRDVEWHSNGSTGDSIFRELTHHYTRVVPTVRRTTTLDLLFPAQDFDFIKIDCQGAELDILAGGPRVVGAAEVLLLECSFAGSYNKGAPTFAEYIRTLDDLGFAPFEITELHRSKNIMCQIDILFVRKTSPLWKTIQQTMVS